MVSRPFQVNCNLTHWGEWVRVPFEGISVSVSRVKADWKCLLQILALLRVSVFKIPFSLSEVIPNASFLRD